MMNDDNNIDKSSETMKSNNEANNPSSFSIPIGNDDRRSSSSSFLSGGETLPSSSKDKVNIHSVENIRKDSINMKDIKESRQGKQIDEAMMKKLKEYEAKTRKKIEDQNIKITNCCVDVVVKLLDNDQEKEATTINSILQMCFFELLSIKKIVKDEFFAILEKRTRNYKDKAARKKLKKNKNIPAVYVKLFNDKEFSSLVECFHILSSSIYLEFCKQRSHIVNYGVIDVAKSICREFQIRARYIENKIHKFLSEVYPDVTTNLDATKIKKIVRETIIDLKLSFPNIPLIYPDGPQYKLKQTLDSRTYAERKKKETSSSSSSSSPSSSKEIEDKMDRPFAQKMHTYESFNISKERLMQKKFIQVCIDSDIAYDNNLDLDIREGDHVNRWWKIFIYTDREENLLDNEGDDKIQSSDINQEDFVSSSPSSSSLSSMTDDNNNKNQNNVSLLDKLYDNFVESTKLEERRKNVAKSITISCFQNLLDFDRSEPLSSNLYTNNNLLSQSSLSGKIKVAKDNIETDQLTIDKYKKQLHEEQNADKKRVIQNIIQSLRSKISKNNKTMENPIGSYAHQDLLDAKIPLFSSHLFHFLHWASTLNEAKDLIEKRLLLRYHTETNKEVPKYRAWNHINKKLNREGVSNIPRKLCLDKITGTILGYDNRKGRRLDGDKTKEPEYLILRRETVEHPKYFVDQLNYQRNTLFPVIGMQIPPYIMKVQYLLPRIEYKGDVQDDNAYEKYERELEKTISNFKQYYLRYIDWANYFSDAKLSGFEKELEKKQSQFSLHQDLVNSLQKLSLG